MTGWSDYRFLESASNLKAAVKGALGREPNTTLATDAATCLRQGRQFFESAADAPIEIRPLLAQYGVIAMGKAVSACRLLRPISTFAKSHGLSDTSNAGARLAELTLKVERSGSFHEFSDSVRLLDSVTYFGPDTQRLRKFVEATEATRLAGKTITFDELFSRISCHHELYSKTFSRDSNVLRCFFMEGRNHIGGELTVYVKGYRAIDRPTLTTIVNGLREKHAFLNRWILLEALCAYDDLRLVFASVAELAVGDTTEAVLEWKEHDSEFRRVLPMPQFRAWQENPPPVSGGLAHSNSGGDNVLRPLQGNQVSEYSILYMAAFMLGTLVRYRPETWVHALAGRVTRDRPLDDQAVALLEAHLTFVLDYFPTIAINAITTRREDVAAS